MTTPFPTSTFCPPRLFAPIARTKQTARKDTGDKPPKSPTAQSDGPFQPFWEGVKKPHYHRHKLENCPGDCEADCTGIRDPDNREDVWMLDMSYKEHLAYWDKIRGRHETKSSGMISVYSLSSDSLGPLTSDAVVGNAEVCDEEIREVNKPTLRKWISAEPQSGSVEDPPSVKPLHESSHLITHLNRKPHSSELPSVFDSDSDSNSDTEEEEEEEVLELQEWGTDRDRGVPNADLDKERIVQAARSFIDDSRRLLEMDEGQSARGENESIQQLDTRPTSHIPGWMFGSKPPSSEDNLDTLEDIELDLDTNSSPPIDIKPMTPPPSPTPSPILTPESPTPIKITKSSNLVIDLDPELYDTASKRQECDRSGSPTPSETSWSDDHQHHRIRKLSTEDAEVEEVLKNDRRSKARTLSLSGADYRDGKGRSKGTEGWREFSDQESSDHSLQGAERAKKILLEFRFGAKTAVGNEGRKSEETKGVDRDIDFQDENRYMPWRRSPPLIDEDTHDDSPPKVLKTYSRRRSPSPSSDDEVERKKFRRQDMNRSPPPTRPRSTLLKPKLTTKTSHRRQSITLSIPARSSNNPIRLSLSPTRSIPKSTKSPLSRSPKNIARKTFDPEELYLGSGAWTWGSYNDLPKCIYVLDDNYMRSHCSHCCLGPLGKAKELGVSLREAEAQYRVCQWCQSVVFCSIKCVAMSHASHIEECRSIIRYGTLPPPQIRLLARYCWSRSKRNKIKQEQLSPDKKQVYTTINEDPLLTATITLLEDFIGCPKKLINWSLFNLDRVGLGKVVQEVLDGAVLLKDGQGDDVGIMAYKSL